MRLILGINGDKYEMIVAHIVDGVDAFINVSQGRPITNSALKLLSLKGSSQSSKEVTLSFICKVEVSHSFLIGSFSFQ